MTSDCGSVAFYCDVKVFFPLFLYYSGETGEYHSFLKCVLKGLLITDSTPVIEHGLVEGIHPSWILTVCVF